MFLWICNMIIFSLLCWTNSHADNPFYLSKGIKWLGKQQNERKYLQNIYLTYVHIKSYDSNLKDKPQTAFGRHRKGSGSRGGRPPHSRWSSTWCKERPILEVALENKAHSVLFLTSNNWNVLHFVIIRAGLSAWAAAFGIITTLCYLDSVLGGGQWSLIVSKMRGILILRDL